MAKVYIKFNSAVIKEVELTKDEMTIGRKPANDIVIDHPTVSGFHGKLKKVEDRWVIEDLKSTNGTFINGRKVESGNLKHKDQIGVASHILELVLDGQPDPAPIETANHNGTDKKAEPSNPTPEENDETPPPAGQAVVRIISGGVEGQTEVQLKNLVTYIGTSDQASIKVKGFLAPSLAAAISKRPEGFFLKAVKPGYPKVNGNSVQEQVFLENGALIEVAGTNMVFYLGEPKK